MTNAGQTERRKADAETRASIDRLREDLSLVKDGILQLSARCDKYDLAIWKDDNAIVPQLMLAQSNIIRVDTVLRDLKTDVAGIEALLTGKLDSIVAQLGGRDVKAIFWLLAIVIAMVAYIFTSHVGAHNVE